MYFLIALSCEVKHVLRKESLLKKLPIAHQFEADLVFISSDKVSSLPWAVRQFLYHMAYETSVQEGQTAPAGFIILIASQAKLTALSPYSFWLPHRLKPAVITPHPSSTFHGSGLFVPTLYLHEVLLCHCWCKQLVSFYDGYIIICCYCAICNTFDCLLSCCQQRSTHHAAHTNFQLETLLQKLDDKASWHKID